MECTLSHRDLATRILCRDFSGLDLTGLNFADRDLSFANFRGANLLDADFTRTKLFRADFRGCRCVLTTFHNALVERADFRGAVGLTPEERTYLRNRAAFVND